MEIQEQSSGKEVNGTNLRLMPQTIRYWKDA